MKAISLILCSALTLGGATAAIAGTALFAAYEPPSQPGPLFSNVPLLMQLLNSNPGPVSVATKQNIENGPTDLANEETLARAAGISLTPPVIVMPPASLNAAPLYNKWWETMKENRALEPMFFTTMTDEWTYTPTQIAQAEAFLAKEHNAFQYLHEALNKPDLVYADAARTHWADLREAAREVESESYLLAYKGEYRKAVANQALGFHIANQLISDPEFYNDIAACATNGLATEGMESILDMAGPNADLDKMALKLVAEDEPKLSFNAALIAKLPYDIATLQKMQTASPAEFANMNMEPANTEPAPTIAAFTPAQQMFVRNWVEAAEAQDIAVTLKLIAFHAHSASERHRLIESEMKRYPAINPVSALDPLLAGFRAWDNPPYTYGTDPLPLPDQQFAVLHARQQVLSAAALVMADKAATGQYPDQLPAKYIDPFSGKPLPYERRGTSGFAVYSVGPRGDFQPSEAYKTVYDIEWSATFSYPALSQHGISNDGVIIK